MFSISLILSSFSKKSSITLSSIFEVKLVRINEGETTTDLMPYFLYSEFQTFDNCSITDFTTTYRDVPTGGELTTSLEIEIINPFFFNFKFF